MEHGATPQHDTVSGAAMPASPIRSADRDGADHRGADPASQVDDLIAALRRLEKFASEESARVSHSLLPKLEARGRENLWASLLLALALGMILGLWAAGGRRGR
ncbi:MAG: hypothetical protein J0L92_11195 [Deltaproteobacteria bacterium]|nr:hypothetical protein [Deltaproteobacteria bacterium]